MSVVKSNIKQISISTTIMGRQTLLFGVLALTLIIAIYAGGLFQQALIAFVGVFFILGWLTLCYRYPQIAITIIIIIGMFQGLIKQILNWTVPVYIGLDIPWLLFLVIWAVRRLSKRSSTMWTILDSLLLIFIIWSLLQIANPGLSSPAMALAAFRARLLPLLFFWVGKDLVTPQSFRNLLLLVACIVGMASLFGIYEWFIGLDGITKWGPGFVPKSSLGWFDGNNNEAVVLRPFSIYQDGILAATFTSVVLVTLLGNIKMWTKNTRIVIILVLISAGTFLGVSGVRTAIIMMFLAGAATWAYHGRRALPGIATGLVAVVLFSLIGGSKMQQRYAQVTNPINAYNANRGTTVRVATSFAWGNPLGTGTGSATNSSEIYAKLFGSSNTAKAPVFDNGLGVIVAEGGFPLLFIYLFILALVVKLTWKQRNSSGDVLLMSQTIFCFTICIIIWSSAALPIDFQPINLLYWLIVGGFYDDVTWISKIRDGVSGLLVDQPGEAEELSKKLTQLLKGKALRFEVGVAARLAVSGHIWSDVALEMLNLYYRGLGRMPDPTISQKSGVLS